jgi:hypothetical protein
MVLDEGQIPNENRILGYSVVGGRPTDEDILVFDGTNKVWIMRADALGDVTGAANLGTGENIFESEIATILNFKSITNSADILLTGSPTELQIALSVAFLARMTTIEGDITTNTAAIILRQLESEKDTANGYAGLSGTSKIANSQISEVLALDDLTDMPAAIADLYLKRNAGDTAWELAAAGGVTENTNLTIQGQTLTMGQWLLF